MSRNIKPISFSKSDEDIVDHLESIDEKFSSYVKRLIRQDMNNTAQDSDVKELVKTLNLLLQSGNITINKENKQDKTDSNVTSKQRSAIANILNI